MMTTLLIALALIVVLCARYLGPPHERCPDCNAIREDNTLICTCGWIFETPDNDPLDYGETEDDF